MANGDTKTPTWQWVASLAISVILLLASAALYETRGDIKDVAKANIEVCNRVTALETANKLQFEAIRDWREEMKVSLRQISGAQDKTAALLTKSSVTLKQWEKLK